MSNVEQKRKETISESEARLTADDLHLDRRSIKSARSQLSINEVTLRPASSTIVIGWLLRRRASPVNKS